MNVLTIDDYMDYIQEAPYKQSIEEIYNLLESPAKLNNVSNKVQTNIKNASKLLSAYGININSLKNTGKRIKKDIVVSYEKGMSVEDTSKLIVSKINKPVRDATKKITKIVTKKLNNTNNSDDIIQKTILSLVGIVIVLIVNTTSLIIFRSIFGEKLGYKIAAIVVGPITEELYKNIAITHDMPWLATGLLASVEAISKIANNKNNYSTSDTIIIRIIGIYFHFVTTLVQKVIIDTKPDDNKIRFTAFVVGVIMHSVWNSL